MQTATEKQDSQPTERPRQTRLESEERNPSSAQQAKGQPEKENGDSQAPEGKANPIGETNGNAATEGKIIYQQTKKTAKVAKARSPRKPKPARKRPLSKFDSDFFKLVRRGEWSFRKICDILGVAPAIARERMLALEKRGMVAFDKLDPDAIRLTIRGYNAFDPRDLTLSLEKKMMGKTARAKTGSIAMGAMGRENNETATGNTAMNSPAPTPAAGTIPTAQPELPKPPEPLPAHAAMDLGELIARGAPRKGQKPHRQTENETDADTRQNQISARRGIGQLLPSAQTAPMPASRAPLSPPREINETAARIPAGGEKCELCKAAFTLHVSGGNPKYGHCFCGAAYHRDCYDEMLGNKLGCARCGKELEIILDRHSRESMRGIKNAFE
ncbi:hypothetical protein HY095_03885 [Candidatus Micrarchaeota archaeon]|nr:hypothetical protein [Candidatus Micrarchaeota archaeon]